MRIRRTTVWSLSLLTLVFATRCRDREQAPQERIVVTRTMPGGAAEEAGLLAGDRVVAFRRAANPPANPQPFASPISSCLDLALFEIEQAPRGASELDIERPRAGAKPRRITVPLPHDLWRIRCRFENPSKAAAKSWDALSQAQEQADQHRKEEADLAFDRAEAAARKAKDEHLLALVLDQRSLFRIETNRFAEAIADARAAIEIRGRIAPDSLELAQSHATLGLALTERRENDAALPELEGVVRVRSAQAPGSLSLAQGQQLLGRLSSRREDLEQAEKLFSAAYETVLARAPESRLSGTLAMNLGVLERRRNLFEAAEAHQRRALAIFRRVDPEAPIVADVLINLSVIATQRGDLVKAEGFLRSSLDFLRERSPGGPGEAAALANLGIIQLFRADFAAAEANLLAALERFEALSPNNPSSARALTNLSTVARALEANDRAESYSTRALAIHRKVEPDSEILAYDLAILAEIAGKRGQIPLARQRLAEAVAMADRQPPSSNVGDIYLRLSELLTELGHVEETGPLVEKANRVLSSVAPGTAGEAEALAHRGRLAQHHQDFERADAAYARALDVLDAAVGRLGGSDTDRSRTRSLYANIYRSAIDVEVTRGDGPRAFHTLERLHARSLLDLLGERDLEAPTDLPRELRNEGRRIDAALTTVDQQLAALDSTHDREAWNTKLAKRSQLLRERESHRASVRRLAPRYAAIVAPQPLELAAARKTLDADTLRLAYSVGERELILFVLIPEGFPNAPPSGLEVHRIPTSRADLTARVTAFRGQLLAKKGLEDPTFRALAERLTRDLLAPAAARLAQAKRISISPDGILEILPFSALTAPAGTASAGRYVALGWPTSTVASATVAAELRRAANETRGSAPLVAFGDPLLPSLSRAADVSADPRRELRGWYRFRQGLSPLPASREEVRRIGTLFRSSEVRFGADATEQRFLADAPQGRRVHFAGHALLDPLFPLESSLALTPPKTPSRTGDDGLLQAWEIFERLRLSADLVVLSACGTALGTEADGEGLLGLTRAFHFAGARVVLSSLWSVADRSTSELMTRFYTHLANGEPEDLALAQAQREMLAKSHAAPFHWAAFRLDGDPRANAGEGKGK